MKLAKLGLKFGSPSPGLRNATLGGAVWRIFNALKILGKSLINIPNRYALSYRNQSQVVNMQGLLSLPVHSIITLKGISFIEVRLSSMHLLTLLG